MIVKELIYKYMPESIIKNRIACIFLNNAHHINNVYRDMSLAYDDGLFILTIKNIPIKLYTYRSVGISLVGYLERYDMKQGDIVIDAGAYPGDFTVYAAKAVGTNGKVIAFEPDPENYRYLLKVISLNELKNVIVVNKGLWSKNTMLGFRSISSQTSSFKSNGVQNENIIEIDAVTLDDELDKLGIGSIDFIKMDIEGAELEALKGARKMLKNKRVRLAVASYHLLNGQQTCLNVEELLSDMGYNSETGFPMHLTTYAWPK